MRLLTNSSAASDRWQATPPAIKLRAIEAQDPSIARPSLTEAAQYKLDEQIRADIQSERTSNIAFPPEFALGHTSLGTRNTFQACAS